MAPPSPTVAVGARARGEALKVNSVLTTWWGPMLALGHVSRVNSALQALNLTRNVVWADGASAPEKTLKVNRALQSLNLTRNAVAAIGARALGEALKVNTMMQELELTNNDGISALGTTAFQRSGKPCT